MLAPALLLALLSTGGPAAVPQLVDVTTVAPGVRLDLRYATPDNFLHAAVYPCARCLLRRPAAEALARAQAWLEQRGYGLLVWDCYRPPAVQREMWRRVPDARYVADPARGSVHNRGGAVDLTLVDASGAPVVMPTPFDDFTPAAAPDAPASPEAAANRKLLREAMEAAGFGGIRTEWWHFHAAGSGRWPIEEAPLCPAPAR
ncbi:MAG: M15 family metallopeptidase [Anaeromyxobacter sp.]